MQFIATLSVVLKNAVRQGLGAPILLVTILAMVVLPLPPAILDLLLKQQFLSSSAC